MTTTRSVHVFSFLPCAPSHSHSRRRLALLQARVKRRRYRLIFIKLVYAVRVFSTMMHGGFPITCFSLMLSIQDYPLYRTAFSACRSAKVAAGQSWIVAGNQEACRPVPCNHAQKLTIGALVQILPRSATTMRSATTCS
jgi:hypothetical protein